jgi:hypothetical protein
VKARPDHGRALVEYQKSERGSLNNNYVRGSTFACRLEFASNGLQLL